MKCPYRTHIYIFRNVNDSETGRTVEFEECYKEECPHYETHDGKEYCNKAESQQGGLWKGGAE